MTDEARYTVNWQRIDRIDFEQVEMDDEDKAVAKLKHVGTLKMTDREYDAYVYDRERQERIASLRYGQFYDHREDD